MAKQIKAIKCPQCGSVKKQEIKIDHYICSNCSTEYFLDTDDINVNINHNYTDKSPFNLEADPKKYWIPSVIVIVFLILGSIALSIFNRQDATGIGEGNSKFLITSNLILSYSEPNSKDPILLFNVSKDYRKDGAEKDKKAFRFYNPISEKLLNEQVIENWKGGNLTATQLFSDGNYYLLADKSTVVFRLNKDQHILEDVTAQLFNTIPEFASGLATLNFMGKNQGDGFKMMTNDGREFFYYPLVQKIYPNYRALMQAREGLSSLEPGFAEEPFFTFTGKSTDFPEEKIQLIKYWYKSNAGYPVNHLVPLQVTWTRDTNSNATNKKILFKEPRVSKFVDISPNRMYFDTKILYQDKEHLYIQGQSDASPTSTKNIQSIHTTTGEVLWTYTPKENSASPTVFGPYFSTYKDGIVFEIRNFNSEESLSEIVLVNNNGQVVKTMNKHKIFK